MVSQQLLSALHTLVLHGLVKRSLWGPWLLLYDYQFFFKRYGFQFGCAVLCRLVVDCGSAIVQRSCQSPQGFGASLPIAWSHPTLVRYKACSLLFSASYSLLVNLLS